MTYLKQIFILPNVCQKSSKFCSKSERYFSVNHGLCMKIALNSLNSVSLTGPSHIQTLKWASGRNLQSFNTGGVIYRGLHEKQGEELTPMQKFKKAVGVYGSTVFVVHIAVSLVSVGIWYTIIVSGVNVEAVLHKFGISSSLAATGGAFVVAYAIHKAFFPVRVGVTLSIVPLVVRYLRKVGILKHKKT